ncbi:hypothetical protein CPC08DRAFT_736059 [Agrocybe pediades]|nr:hypothetical protein CPC08DRAFT_736059 [Agrocybe pediades]
MSSRRPTPFVAILCAFLCMMEGAMLRVYAGLFIVDPHAGSTCQAGVPCTVSWVDDGMRPLFSAIGVSTVALYTGKQQLVQRIAPVDVTKQASLTFVPIAGAGPDSDAYYIAITSTTAKGNDTTTLYSGWSPFFRITGMSGSFDSPLAAATKEIPIPASLTQSTASIASSAQSTTVTITIGAPTTTPSSSVPSTASSARTSQNASASSSKPTTSAAVASASASASASANRLGSIAGALAIGVLGAL